MSDRAIIEAINKIVGNHKNDQVVYANATIDSVDIDSRTCVCTLIDNHTEYQITAKLTATVDDGLLLIPSIDSTVKIILSRDVEPFVCQYSGLEEVRIDAVDKIVFNNGENTTAKADILHEELNKAKARIDAIINAINTCVPSGTETGLVTIKTAVGLIVDVEDYSLIENENVVHG